jgi:hypothetical protein
MTTKTSTTSQFVDTLWNQFEQSVNRAEDFRERQEDAYLQTVKQVVSFNKNVRDSFVNLYETTKQRNSTIAKGVAENITSKVESTQTVSPVITEQLRESTKRLEQFSETPLKLTLSYLDRLDQGVEAANENLIRFSRERRHAWQSVANGYVQAARNNHKNVVARFEESLKIISNPK